jgi:hypothetical protein
MTFHSKNGDNLEKLRLSEMSDTEFVEWVMADASTKNFIEEQIFRRSKDKYVNFLTEKMIYRSLQRVVKEAYQEILFKLQHQVEHSTIKSFTNLMTKDFIDSCLSEEFLIVVKERILVLVYQSTEALRTRFDHIEQRMDSLASNQDALLAYIKELALRVESKS